MAVEEVDEATVELSAETLLGDVRDAILDNFRAQHKPWKQMTEVEQRDFNQRINNVAGDLVRRSVEIIAGHGRKTIAATLEQITVKEGFKLVLTVPQYEENRHEMVDHTGSKVLLVIADVKDFSGQKADPITEPNQTELDLGDGDADGDGMPAADEEIDPETGEIRKTDETGAEEMEGAAV